MASGGIQRTFARGKTSNPARRKRASNVNASLMPNRSMTANEVQSSSDRRGWFSFRKRRQAASRANQLSARHPKEIRVVDDKAIRIYAEGNPSGLKPAESSIELLRQTW